MAIQSSAKKSRENAHKNYTNLYSFDIIFTLFIINIFIASLNNIEKRREEKRRAIIFSWGRRRETNRPVVKMAILRSKMNRKRLC